MSRRDRDLKSYGLSRENRINLVGAIIMVGFVLSVVYHYIMGSLLGYEYPFNTFLFMPAARFGDFYEFYNIVSNYNPYFTKYFLHSSYYPFANVFMYLFALFSRNLALVIYSVVFFVSMIGLNINYLWSKSRGDLVRNVAAFSFLTYAFLFCFDRGNMEAFVFIFLAVFVYLYEKKRTSLSLLFLTMAIAMKAFPAVFLLILLADRKYREMAQVIAGTIGLTLLSLLLHKGGFIANLNFMLSGFNIQLDGFHGSVIYISNNLVQRGVSLFTFSKIALNAIGLIDVVNMSDFYRGYILFVMLSFVLLAAYVIVIEKEQWKRIALTVIAMLLFPHISVDYKLLYVFIPMWLWINHQGGSVQDRAYALMFGLLLIPKDYLIIPFMVTEAGNDVSINIPINVILLFSMMGLVIITGLKKAGIAKIRAELLGRWAEYRELLKRYLAVFILLVIVTGAFLVYAGGVSRANNQLNESVQSATNYYNRGQYFEAAEACQNYLQQHNGGNADLYNIMSSAYLSLKNWSGSEKAALQALQIAPDFRWARINLSLARTADRLDGAVKYHGQGRYRESIAVCEQVIKVAPDNPMAYNLLSADYIGLQDWTNAVAAAQQALAIAPRYESALSNFNLAKSRLDVAK